MDHKPGVDNDEQLFQFDPCEGSSDMTPLCQTSLETSNFHGRFSHQCSFDDSEMASGMGESESSIRKGKGVASLPMPIRSIATIEHDIFDILPSKSSADEATDSCRLLSSTPPLSPTSDDYRPPALRHGGPHSIHIYSSGDEMVNFLGIPSDEPSFEHMEVAMGKEKGKEKEYPPTLPPLTFSPTEFGYGQTEWPSSSFSPPTPGPSSYGSGCGSLSNVKPLAAPQSFQLADAATTPPVLTRIPSRRRSLSNLSVHSTGSVAAPSISRIRVGFGTSRGPRHLARKLLFKRPSTSPPSQPRLVQVIDSEGVHSGQGNCLVPWCGDFKSSPDAVIMPFANDIDLRLESQSLPLYHSNRVLVKAKGRSNSSPLPLSAFDIVLSPSTNVFSPIPLIVRNYFDEILPRELKLQVLQALITLHEEDHNRAVQNGTWTFSKASSSKGRWVGRNKGIRELVKFSRVSKSWQKLVFDGQLWTDLDLHSFPGMPVSLVKRLAEIGGCFVRSINLAGHLHLLSSTLIEVADKLCLPSVPSKVLTHNQLTSICLQGCLALTTRSLHHLLIRSPLLQKLIVKGLTAVTNTTCEILAVYCGNLTCLDMSRCPNMDAEGVRALAASALSRGEHLQLKQLHLSGLTKVTDVVMATLGKAAPYLEDLDLSYTRQLHNSALEAFISCESSAKEEELGVKTILLSARDAGRDASDASQYRKRITRLRHLNLSSCILLTDVACSNLAYTVPQLEFLELAGIGAELKDDGLVRLLATTPYIRRLDLEDASDITDSVIAALTPTATPASDDRYSRTPIPEPGHALEHLVISYAGEISDDALLALIRSCPRLCVLEADNTRMGPSVLKEFVRLSRQRQMVDSKIVAIDCRAIGETVVRSLIDSTRPRLGWRAYDARKLKYLDGRDGEAEDLKVGQDECDERRVVIKTFYSWQTVDAVRAVRDKRRKNTSRRTANASAGNASDEEDGGGRGRPVRWWSPSGTRRGLGSNSPQLLTDPNNEGCRVM